VYESARNGEVTVAVLKLVDFFTDSSIKNIYNQCRHDYKSPANLLGDCNHTPKVTLSKLIRTEVDIPEINIHSIADAKIIGERLIICNGEALKSSFLNKRVAHESAVKRTKDEDVDVDDKFLSDKFPETEYDKAFWLCGQYGSYQHWFTETLPILSLYKKNYDDVKSSKIIVGHDIKSYQIAVLKNLGIEEKNIVRKDKNTNLKFKTLIAADNLSLNSFWIHPEIKDAYSEIFSWIKEEPAEYAENIILGRKQLGNVRQVFNFDTVEKALADKGYQIIFPEDMSFNQKFNCFRNAKKIVSLSGGGLCNIIFSKPGTAVLAISPDSFPINSFRDFADIYDLKITYCLARSFLRFDDMNLNANSFLTNELIKKITEEIWTH
jgi:hypothetical protein